jgi:hydroxymethylbilane synthase
MLPAPGQAVLVIETRGDDVISQEIVSALNHEPSRLCSSAERLFLAEFGGGCSVPVAAFATYAKGAIHISGLVAAPNGSQILRGTSTGVTPGESAKQLFDVLRDKGAMNIFGGAQG